MKKRIRSIPDIRKFKGGDPLVMVTAYDYSMARILDRCEIDIILIGDSVGTTQLGYPNTLSVTMSEMIHHIAAVARGVKQTVIIGDMPFGSSHISPTETRRNAVEMIRAGAHGVKLEGAHDPDTIESLVRSGIPVMGHVGLIPQSIHAMGGYRVQGRKESDRDQIMSDALRLQQAGVFSIVIECVPPSCARIVTHQLDIPTIGIGAGPHCDGQVLVINDLLGMNPDFLPVFVKQYADIHRTISDAVRQFSLDVRNRSFPDGEHSYPEENDGDHPVNS
ncbi:3-methyl-2-oxobutanoate hydroxymethyltransferase [bacterium]|nr:3-methyl-2-oxobutanoate hydroxymethyltransferase [candidate division CSSED10-310 bacterium]